jgi:hypothetical protein
MDRVPQDISRAFESIESAHEFIVVLEGAIIEAVRDVQVHLDKAAEGHDERQTHALSLAMFKLNQLSLQMHKSRRNLNDLRTIRRLLFGERDGTDE